MCIYDLFHILLSVWHTCGSMEYMYVCMYVCKCVYMYWMFKLTDINVCMLYLWSRLNSLYHDLNGVILHFILQLMLCLRSLSWDIVLYQWVKEPWHFKTKYIIFKGHKVQEEFFFYIASKYWAPTAYWQSVASQKDVFSSAALLWKPQNLYTKCVCIELC